MADNTSIFRKDILGWSLYDFANTIFSMNIISLYLKRYIVEDLGHPNAYFDIPFSASMLLAAILLPALGTISDRGGKKKIFLFLFTLSCCVATGFLAFIPPDFIMLIGLLLVISNFTYEAGQPFYNALLYSVAEGKRARFVSGLGVSLGYVGAILGMIMVLPFVSGDLFGWDVPFIEAGGKSAAFIPTAILFFVFAIPVFLWVREKPVKSPKRTTIAQAYRDVWHTVKDTQKYPGVLRFLIADFFLEDAVVTVIVNMGLYTSIVIGFSNEQITTFLIVSTVSAVIGSLIIGKLAERLELKRLLVIIVVGWIVGLLMFVLSSSQIVIWILGSVVGILLGGLWTVTRPMLAEMVPKEELGRFFGLFSLSGRAASMLGPLVWTAVVFYLRPDSPAGVSVGGWFGLDSAASVVLPYKAAIIALVGMMIVGLIILRKVPVPTEVKHG